jgi:hydrogenase maturation protease
VQVIDFGIRGLDLTYALLDDYEAVILVDATPRGGEPGTLYVLELDTTEPTEAAGAALCLEAHSLDPVRVLHLARAMGAPARRVLLVGCEPGRLSEWEDMSAGLSEPVRAAVDEALPLVESLVAGILRGESLTPAVGTATP